MKAIIRLINLSLASAMIFPVMAQETKKKTEKDEQIIIRKKGETDQKMTIVVDGDNITVNGKSLDEFEKENKDVDIIRRKSLRDAEGGNFDVFVSPDIKIAPRIYSMPRRPGAAIAPRMRYYNNFGEGKTSTRAYLGVMSKDNDKGAEITEVNDNTPAAKAGLQKGDIITKVGSKEVKDPSSLLEAVKANKPNDEVEVSYLRDGKQKKAKVKLGETKETVSSFNFEMPDMPDMNFNFDHDWAQEFKGNMDNFNKEFREFRWDDGDAPFALAMTPRPRLGAKIADLEEGDGVKVLDVESEMAGAKAGLQKDDIITEIDGKSIKNSDEAREALKDLKDKTAYQLKVKRGTETKTLDVKVPKKIKTANL